MQPLGNISHFSHLSSVQYVSHPSRLELIELLDLLPGPWQHTQDIEAHLHHITNQHPHTSHIQDITYSLAQRPTLPDGHLIAVLQAKCRAHVHGQVLVPLLVARVLGDEVQVLTADDAGAVHFGADDGAGEDAAADGDEAGEGAFLVWSRQFVLARVDGSLLKVYWYEWMFCKHHCFVFSND